MDRRKLNKLNDNMDPIPIFAPHKQMTIAQNILTIILANKYPAHVFFVDSIHASRPCPSHKCDTSATWVRHECDRSNPSYLWEVLFWIVPWIKYEIFSTIIFNHLMFSGFFLSSISPSVFVFSLQLSTIMPWFLFGVPSGFNLPSE